MLLWLQIYKDFIKNLGFSPFIFIFAYNKVCKVNSILMALLDQTLTSY